MLKKVLVAVDESVASRRAFESATELAKALRAKLVIVRALDVFDPASPQHPTIAVDNYSMQLDQMVQENYQRQWTEFVEHSEALIKQRQQEAENLGIETTYMMPYGRPGPAICRMAKEAEADLIVVGSRGRDGLTEMILGSVTNYIMHHAPCSVTVVHSHSSNDKGGDSVSSDHTKDQDQHSVAAAV